MKKEMLVARIVYEETDKTNCPQLELVTEGLEVIGYITPMKGLCFQISPNTRASKSLATSINQTKIAWMNDSELTDAFFSVINNFTTNVYGSDYHYDESNDDEKVIAEFLEASKNWAKVFGYH